VPTSCSNCCVTNYSPALSTPTRAFANMSYVGFMKLDSALLSQKIAGVLNQILRVNSCGIVARQPIEKVDVIDGRIDGTVYRVLPLEVGGPITMPIVADTLAAGTCPTGSDLQGTSSVAAKLLNLIWCWSTTRDPQGRIAYDDVNADVRLANHAAFRYNNCVVNSLTFNCAQGDLLSAELDIIAQGRTPLGSSQAELATTNNVQEANISDYLSPARTLQWSDISITGIAGCSATDVGEGAILFSSNLIRSWDLRIENNAQRYYTFQGSLTPVDINAGKRTVSGSIELMGISDNLRRHAENNSARFTEKNKLRFAFYVGDDTFQGSNIFRQRDWTGIGTDLPANAIFGRELGATIFEIEEAALNSNELFTSRVQYHCMALDDDNYQFSNKQDSSFPVWS